MLYRLCADAVVIIHALFIIFTVLGGLLVLRWRWVMLLHIPAAAWGVIVQVVQDGKCPLTPLEWYFRDKSGEAGYRESFIDHYLTSLIYVNDPPPWLHTALGIGVGVINGTVYGIVIYQWLKGRRQRSKLSVGASADAAI